MSSQTLSVIMGVLILLVAARFVAAVVVRARPGSALGLRTRATLSGEDAWLAGHAAARMLLLLGAGLAILDSFALVLAASGMGLLATAGMGAAFLLLLGVLWLTARSLANKAARGAAVR